MSESTYIQPGSWEIPGAGPVQKPEKIRYILTSHSIDNLFDYCPRKFEFLNVFDKRPPRESGFAASVGTALHEGTQAWLIARAEGLDEGIAKAKGYWQLLLWYPWAMEREQANSMRSFDKAILMLRRIMESNVWDNWELVKIEEHGWAVEVPFLIRHVSVGTFRLKQTGELCMLATQGKIDFILRNKRNGKIKTWDLKTTITSPDLVRAEWEFSGQQVGYSNVVQAMVGGIIPDDMSFHYLVCRFSATEEPEIQPFDVAVQRDDIEDYWFSKIDRLHRIKNYAEAGWFPRTNGGCHSWGRECSCFDICHSRDYELIKDWFRDIGATSQDGYDYWIELDV